MTGLDSGPMAREASFGERAEHTKCPNDMGLGDIAAGKAFLSGFQFRVRAPRFRQNPILADRSNRGWRPA